MEDIIMTLPSYSDDCDSWTQNFIWGYDDGTYTICDECGDHEPLEASDVPSDEEFSRLWREYSQWVLDTGRDPLGEFNVRHTRKVKERWFLRIGKTLVGPRLLAARRGKTIYQPGEIPEHLRSFLNLTADFRLGDFKFWEDLIKLEPTIKPWKWWACQLEQDQPRPDAAIARELRKAAREHLLNHPLTSVG